MLNHHSAAEMPSIVVSDTDQERLSSLARAAMTRLPEIAEDLMTELGRADVVTADAVPAGVVRMGSIVEFSSSAGRRMRVQLVFPEQADIAAGRISVLTPIGTALIGLAEGQTIVSTTRDGREQELTVLSVDSSAVGH